MINPSFYLNTANHNRILSFPKWDYCILFGNIPIPKNICNASLSVNYNSWHLLCFIWHGRILIFDDDYNSFTGTNRRMAEHKKWNQQFKFSGQQWLSRLPWQGFLYIIKGVQKTEAGGNWIKSNDHDSGTGL